MLERVRHQGSTQVTFVLPAEHPCCDVSVVGDFNDWQPGAHPLSPRKNGTRSVTVALPAESRVHFRYLAHGDYWFDDDQADGHDGTNSYLHT
ncbi:isoamylase early set domain-containing protein [Kitasatospora sp. MAP5-34]|uniref:isoamylase early set domain-containing protein n=1 Tax=Kitasatospora sp. MAP5-34 TaxID=3035102 RepID=UPI002474748E|nr:isoamylase early set domain-containing protein [Kitasatospora sp. MAP5-34]MDH6580480.1 1,4-alpha-glucan branching enzyme [Kitasatospora sp. MAP5-34]